MRTVRLSWLVLLSALSMAPWAVKVRLGVHGRRHNLYHFAAFFVTIIVFSTIFDHQNSDPDKNRSSLRHFYTNAMRCAAVAMVAGMLEGAEAAIFHNHFEWLDVAVDCFGIAAGFAVLTFWQLITSFDQSSAQTTPR